MGRPRMPVGAHGTIKLDLVEKGKWRARTLYRFPDGKRRQVERHAGTKAAANNVLLAALTKIDTPAPGSSSPTVAFIGRQFIQLKRDAKVAPGTIEAYESRFNGIIEKRLGSMAIREVTPMHLQAFVTEVTATNGPSSAKTCKAILSGLFKLAIRRNIITASPLVGLEPIKLSGEAAAKGLPVDEMRRLIATVQADTHLAERDFPDIWEFMSYTGCRIAEALALRWKHVDAKKGQITLGPVVTRERGKGSFISEPGKTGEWRTIVIPKPALALLERRVEIVPDAGLDLVFPTPLGALRSTSAVNTLWVKERDRLGYPAFSSHGFRKTVATVLDEAGLSARDIAEYLGHKNPSMTQDVYMSKNTQSKKAAAALASKFGVSSGSTSAD